MIFLRVKELRGESDPRLLSLHSNHHDLRQLSPTVIVSKSTITEGVMMIDSDNKHPPPIQNEYQKITLGHIRDFIHHHKIQVEALEEYLRGSTELLDGFELDFKRLISKRSSFRNIKSKYRRYKRGLDDQGDRVLLHLEDLKARIRQELEDEEVE